MPIISFDNREAIPAGLEKDAKEVDGKFQVDVSLTSQVREFRDNNVALKQEREELTAKVRQYADIVGDDLAAFRTDLDSLRSTHQQVKDGKLKTTDAISAEVADRVRQAGEAHAAKETKWQADMTAEKERGDKFEGLYKRSLRDQAVTGAVMAAGSGVNPSALPDILSRASSVFSVEEDGSIVAKDRDGKMIYGEDASASMTPSEWIAKLLVEAPHFGKQNTGGGANGDKGGNAPGGMSKEAFDKLPPAERMTLARQQKK